MGATLRGNMGQTIAGCFLEEGARVIVAGRTAAGLETLRERQAAV